MDSIETTLCCAPPASSFLSGPGSIALNPPPPTPGMPAALPPSPSWRASSWGSTSPACCPACTATCTTPTARQGVPLPHRPSCAAWSPALFGRLATERRRAPCQQGHGSSRAAGSLSRTKLSSLSSDGVIFLPCRCAMPCRTSGTPCWMTPRPRSRKTLTVSWAGRRGAPGVLCHLLTAAVLHGAATAARCCTSARAGPPMAVFSGCAVPQPCPAACAAIMKALLADIGGAQWRVRESAALAMADLLQASPGRWQGICPGCWLSHAEH